MVFIIYLCKYSKVKVYEVIDSNSFDIRPNTPII